LCGIRQDFAGAEVCFERAIEMSPRDPAVLHGFGTMLERMREYARAETCFLQVRRGGGGRTEPTSPFGVVTRVLTFNMMPKHFVFVITKPCTLAPPRVFPCHAGADDRFESCHVPA
jgi:hypothetical protein